MTNGDDDDENDDDDGLFCLVTDKRFRRYKVEWYRLGRATTEQYLYSSSSSSRKKKVHLAISSLFSIAHLNFVWVLRMFVVCLLFVVAVVCVVFSRMPSLSFEIVIVCLILESCSYQSCNYCWSLLLVFMFWFVSSCYRWYCFPYCFTFVVLTRTAFVFYWVILLF